MKLSKTILRKLILEELKHTVIDDSTTRLTRKNLRTMILKTITEAKWRDPTDDPRFSDPSYGGGPGLYYSIDDEPDKFQEGISIVFVDWDSNHALWPDHLSSSMYDVRIEFSDFVEDFDKWRNSGSLTTAEEKAIEEYGEALIAHPDSKLSEEKQEEALEELGIAINGGETSGEYFEPFYEGDDQSDDYDYDGPDDYYDPGHNFGPDVWSS